MLAAVLVVAWSRRSSAIRSPTSRARGGDIPIAVPHFAVLGECSPRRCAACSICRPIGSLLLPIEFPAILSRRRDRIRSSCCAARCRARKNSPSRSLRRCRWRRPVVSWLLVSHASATTTIWPARRLCPPTLILDRGGGRRNARRRAARASIAAIGAWRPRSQPAGHRANDARRISTARRDRTKRFRAVARTMGGGAPLCAAERACRQQSALPAGPDAVAGEYFLGAARQSQLLLCRPRNGAGLCAAAAGTPRGDQCAIHSRVCRRRHAGRRRRHGEGLWLRCRRGGAAGWRLGQRSVRREPGLPPGRSARRALEDLRAESRSSPAGRPLKFRRTN